MVKGMTRRIVEIKETGSSYFERAIFFVRMGTGANASESTLAQEASGIIDRLCEDLKIRDERAEKLTSIARVVGSALLGAAVAVIAMKLL